MFIRRLKLYALVFCIFGSVVANADVFDLQSAHTKGEVSIANGNNWQISFIAINEADKAEFLDSSNNIIQPGVIIPIESSYNYGFSFLDGADFDIAYVITAIEKTQQVAYPDGNPKCILIVTAKSAGVPDVRVDNFQGAACTVENTRVSAGHLILK